MPIICVLIVLRLIDLNDKGREAMLEDIVVKRLQTIEQFQEMQLLEQEIWNRHAIPVTQLVAVNSNGGIILGAYQDTELVGINYAFPAFKNGQVYLYSLILGVKRKYREQGIGELLKIE